MKAYVSKWTVNNGIEISGIWWLRSEGPFSKLFYYCDYQGSHKPWKSLSWDFDKNEMKLQIGESTW